jgi:hypothetical protein
VFGQPGGLEEIIAQLNGLVLAHDHHQLMDNIGGMRGRLADNLHPKNNLVVQFIGFPPNKRAIAAALGGLDLSRARTGAQLSSDVLPLLRSLKVRRLVIKKPRVGCLDA